MFAARISAALSVAGCVATAMAAQRSSPDTYRIIDLTDVTRGPLGLAIVDATFVDEAGVVVGIGFEPVEGKPVALRWTDDGAVVEVLRLLRGDDNASEAWAIDAQGRPLGASDRITFEGGPGPIRIFQDPVAVRWGDDGDAQRITDLLASPAPYQLASVRGVASDGRMIGWGREPSGTVGLDFKGWLLETDGTLIDLGELDRPRALSDGGLIVGYRSSGQDKAFVWDDGALTNLHDHPSISGVTSRAYDTNSAGLIVGEAQFDISQPEYATVWRDTGGGYEPIHVLEGLFVRPQGVARSITEDGTIVGWWADLATPPFVGIQAFILPDGVDGEFLSLIDLVPDAASLGWERLQRADHINENGWIVGTGVRDGVLGHAFLLIPIRCAPDLDGDGRLTVFDFLEFQNLFDAGDPRADFDGDGRLTLFDLLAFQNAFNDGCE